MTVAELIVELQKLDQTRRVVIRAYENGVDEVASIDEVCLILNAYTEWYYGKHDIAVFPDEPYDEIAYHIRA